MDTTVWLEVAGGKEAASVHKAVSTGAELACEEGERTSHTARHRGEAGGAVWAEHGRLWAEVAFEGVFHEDLSDKPNWKGECLQSETWEEALQQPGGSGGDGETRGRQQGGQAPAGPSFPRATRSLAASHSCMARLQTALCCTSTDSSSTAGAGHLQEPRGSHLPWKAAPDAESQACQDARSLSHAQTEFQTLTRP